MQIRHLLKVCIVIAAFFTVVEHAYGDERELPSVEIRPLNGRPTVFIDGEPNALPGYCPARSDMYYEKYMPNLYKQMAVYYLHLVRTQDGPRFWVGDRIENYPITEVDDRFFTIDKQAERILQGDPDAYLIIRFYIWPPKSWSRLHPQEIFIKEDGTPHERIPSLASDLYWEKASEFSAKLIRYCESRPWARNVIAYNNIHLNEGTHLPVAEGWFFDHNPSMVHKFRELLRNKYGTIETLRAEYGDNTLTFENIDVPKDKLRGTVPEVTNLLYWQNAKDNQALRDYLELTRDLFHKRFRQLGTAMAGAVERKVLFIHDALKQPMLGWHLLGFFAQKYRGRHKISWNLAYPELQAGSGHMGVTKLFDAAGFDAIMTPHDYQARSIGGVYEPEGIADATILRGKYFFAEMDTRIGPKGIGTARNPQEWAAITWRNFASSFTRGFNSYWHHGFQSIDWFNSEPVQKTIRRQVEAINESLHWVHETVPGIAMILDDSAVLETNGSGNYYNEAIMWEQKMGMARCGVPFRIYMFEDLMLDNFPKHKVFYFPNLFRADEEKLAVLKEKVFRDGNVVIWGPGSGISDGKTISTGSATKLTGFEFEMIPANAPRRILISNFDHPITKDLDAAMVIGGPLPYGPVLLPTDGTELGSGWTKGGTNQIGMSLKEFGKGAAGKYNSGESLGKGDYAAVFMIAVQIPAKLWRNVARYAGAHVYTESNDVLLADKSVVALHSLKSGEKRISLPGRFRVKDLISGELYSRRTGEIKFNLKAPETRVFLLE